MPLKLYFANEELRSCWPVDNVNGQPTQVEITRQSNAYRNQHNHQLIIQLANGSAVNGVITLPGMAMKAGTIAAATLTGGNPNPYPSAFSLGDFTLAPSDEVSGAELQQSPVDFTHWQVPVEAAVAGDPTFVLISMDQYPDGFSNQAPSWWVDPNP